MAKKKVKQQIPGLSPEKYIRTKVRSLPIAECLITPEWQEAGECKVIIARKHTNGNYTVGYFLVDTFCLGVKECFYKFNVPEHDYEDTKVRGQLVLISYNEAHNIIFGALAYAEDLGIAPHKDFETVQYILEPDTEEIPLIEFEFGSNGKPFLIVRTREEANRYLPALRKSAGNDFDVMIGEEEEFDDDEEFDDNEEDTIDLSAKLQRIRERYEALPHTEYAYVHPDYPKELKLNHDAELQVFFSPDHSDKLDKDHINRILSLPPETLTKDLEHLILYEIGRTCEEISPEMWDTPWINPLMHALFFLGELKAEESLQTVLEVMRQNDSFSEFHFEDVAADVLPLTLYYVGRNQLSTLTEFAKEPGLNPFLKTFIFDPMSMIATYEPERRGEVIDRFGEILDFYLEKIEDSAFFDGGLAGMMLSNILDIKAVELLPKIEQLFATGKVDEMCCGDYPIIEKEMMSRKKPLHEYSLMNIYERYKDSEQWSNA